VRLIEILRAILAREKPRSESMGKQKASGGETSSAPKKPRKKREPKPARGQTHEEAVKKQHACIDQGEAED
jgi:hypothetical protein